MPSIAPQSAQPQARQTQPQAEFTARPTQPQRAQATVANPNLIVDLSPAAMHARPMAAHTSLMAAERSIGLAAETGRAIAMALASGGQSNEAVGQLRDLLADHRAGLAQGEPDLLQGDELVVGFSGPGAPAPLVIRGGDLRPEALGLTDGRVTPAAVANAGETAMTAVRTLERAAAALASQDAFVTALRDRTDAAQGTIPGDTAAASTLAGMIGAALRQQPGGLAPQSSSQLLSLFR